MARVLIAIPAYNEALFLQSLLFEIQKYVPKENILVVNDGSSDGTDGILAKLDVKVIKHSSNLGKGAALSSAFCWGQEYRYDWIIALDGDGQHPPKHLPFFLDEINKDQADMILANRVARKKRMPFHRILSNGITSIIVSLCAGNSRVHDSQCGFRAIRLSAVKSKECSYNGFQFESELIMRLGKKGCKFKELAIETCYGKEKSSINLFGDTCKFIALVVKSFFW
jgi:glycosyltransferase involved in cell wall biosynthesis